MRFSILIPARNCFGYLNPAVEFVMPQNHENWQRVVSDSYSEYGSVT